MLTHELASHISSILDLTVVDMGMNGVQVERSGPIRKLLTAVDFSEALLERAVEEKADAVMVHHGLFWGKPSPITDRYYRLFRGLLLNNIALFAYHLPLDLHPQLGNNILLLQALGAEYRNSFGDYKGVALIMAGEMKPISWEDFMARFRKTIGVPIAVMGPELPPEFRIRRVGVCTGGGLFGLEDAHRHGCDVYITGDANHIYHHTAKELGITLVCGGHYNTEVWGVRALGERLGEELGLTVKFTDIPTGL